MKQTFRKSTLVACGAALLLLAVAQLMCLLHFHESGQDPQAQECVMCQLQHESLDAAAAEPVALPAEPLDCTVADATGRPNRPALRTYSQLRAPPAA